MIRPVAPSDESEFVQAVKEYVLEYANTEEIVEVDINKNIGEVYWQEVTLGKNYIVLIAENDNKLVGFCIGEIHFFDKVEAVYFKGDKRGQVWDVYVTKDARGEGVGGQLINRMEEELKKRGCENMLIQGVAIVNSGAKRLYQRMGFVPWQVTYFKKLE
jgi:GNAT superfamily N-acetyltransferase